jgi:Uma2 family endonuclease
MSALLETTSAVYLCPELAGTLMTPEEFDAVTDYEEGYVYELIHGVLVVNPIPLAAETGPNERLGVLLYLYQVDHPGVIDLTLPQQYVHTTTGRRIADRLIWAGLGRAPDRRRDTPTVAVEFVSRARRDRRRDYVEKRREYLEAGVTEYWIIDRFRRMLTAVRPGPDGPRDEVVAEGATFTTPLLPEFELPLAELLAVADRLDEPAERG